MRIRMAVLLLLLIVVTTRSYAQAESPSGGASSTAAEESVDASQPDSAVTRSTTPTNATSMLTARGATPGWIHLVRLAAVAGPIAFLLLAWTIGAIVHYRIVRREQDRFPSMRGSRAPQTVPMILSAALFLPPAILFTFFEVRSRLELRRGIGGVLDEWLPVTAHAWIALLVCLALALIPWLFARRADTVT